MPLCQTSAPQATPVRAALAGFSPQTRLLFLILLLILPFSGEAAPLRLVGVQFPDALSIEPGIPEFAPPPSPWLIAPDLPTPDLTPAPPLDAEALARRFDGIAAVPLLERADAGDLALATALARLAEPRPVPIISAAGTPGDDGSSAYLLLSSMILFTASTLIGYAIRERPAYSLGAEWHQEGGRRTLPPLLLPPAPASVRS